MEDPVFWEGSQYLLETEVDPTSDPDQPEYRYTEAALKAQDAEWQRLKDNRKPRKNIPSRLLASSGNSVPYLLYGWPFNQDNMIQYAKRHSLVYQTTENNRAAFGGVDEFNFNQITDDHLKNHSWMRSYGRIATRLVLRKLIKATGLHVELGRPFTFEYDNMLVLWSNRSIEQYAAIPMMLGTFERGKTIIEAAVREINPGKKVELSWWWSWNGNDVGVFESLE
ncbi:hypothetical protein OH76DRAFT_1489642 [Lentinus brumalis]|uniref:Uncharacterized protein n=1 Tax=Lentinus brumalis TaxID=2498619 RepID=A0A371CLU7_9APHY|nr:hypothetical protein OH76DRAFT_1489642 [Polyporus brumalis]